MRDAYIEALHHIQEEVVADWWRETWLGDAWDERPVSPGGYTVAIEHPPIWGRGPDLTAAKWDEGDLSPQDIASFLAGDEEIPPPPSAFPANRERID